MRLLRLASLLVPLSAFASAATASSPPYERRVLDNGAVLLVSEQRALPMVDVEILVDAGSRRDPAGQEGLANLTADLLNEGTRGHSATELADAVESLGASLSSSASIDSASLDLRVLRSDLDAGLALLGEILLQPSFPADEIERRREAILAGMRAAEDRPGWLAYRAFLDAVYGQEPYGHLVEGTPDSVSKLARAGILEFYRQYYGPNHAIITVVGDIDMDEAAARIENVLADWKPRTVEPFVYPPSQPATADVRTIQKPLTQANIVLGHRGIARSDPDYYAVEVMNYILGGGGFGSRLLDRIRTENGLAYSVSSAFATPEFPGSFRITMQTKKESTREAVRLTCEELLRIRTEPVSDDELEGAKLYLTGNFPLQLDSNRKIAGFLSMIEFFDLGADYAETYVERIRAVTKDDILRAARRHIHPDRLQLILVGDVTWTPGEKLDCAALANAEKPPA